MRNNTLANVRFMVKAQCAKSLQSSSTAQDTEINQIISDTQSVLAGEFNFPFLKTRWSLTVPAGQRYTTFPSVSDLGVTTSPVFERPGDVWVKWNMIWQPVVYGIDEYPEFNYLDSDRNQVLDPVQRWQFSDEYNFEVWPLPASQASIRYVGQRQLTPLFTTTFTSVSAGISTVNATWVPVIVAGLGSGYYNQNSGTPYYIWYIAAQGLWVVINSNVPATVANSNNWAYTATSITGTWTKSTVGVNPVPVFTANQPVFVDSQTLDLDDVLVSLFSAAEYLTRKESARAPGVLAAANRRLASELGAYPTRTEIICIGRGDPLGRRMIRQVPLVMVGGSIASAPGTASISGPGGGAVGAG